MQNFLSMDKCLLRRLHSLEERLEYKDFLLKSERITDNT